MRKRLCESSNYSFSGSEDYLKISLLSFLLMQESGKNHRKSMDFFRSNRGWNYKSLTFSFHTGCPDWKSFYGFSLLNNLFSHSLLILVSVGFRNSAFFAVEKENCCFKQNFTLPKQSFSQQNEHPYFPQLQLSQNKRP